MKCTRSLLLALLCAVAAAAPSQAQRRSEYRIELGRAAPLDVEGFYFDALEDARADSAVIGSVQVGLNNRRVDAVLAEPLRFSGFRIANMIVVPDRAAQPLTLKITAIQVDEHTTIASEEGVAFVAAEVVFAGEGGEGLVLYRGESEARKRGMSDVSGKLGGLIVEALTDLIAEFAATDWRTTIASGGLGTVTAPSHRSEEAPGFPFAAPPQQALYLNSRDFAHDTRADLPFRVVQRGGTPPHEAYAVKYERGTKDPRAFAVSYRGILYLSAAVATGGYATKRQLLRAHFVGPYAYFEIAKTDAGAAVAFGALGALASMRTFGVALDTRTGQTHLLDDQTLEKLTVGHEDLRERIGENRRRNPAGSREIIRALNERLAAAG